MTSVSTETMTSATSALVLNSGARSSTSTGISAEDGIIALVTPNKPFKIVDAQREIRMGLTAGSLDELEDRAKTKFQIPLNLRIRIVLESDGTEIDDNDYFDTLDPDTSLMILCEEERWTPYKSNFVLGLAIDRDEGSAYSPQGSEPRSPSELIWSLHQDLSFFPWLTPKELETIAQMDKEEMKKVVPDVRFLEFLQDLSEKYIQEKRGNGNGGNGAGETFSSSGSSSSMDMGGESASAKGPSGTTILHDPIKLIRMYSKSKHFIHNHYDPPSQQSQRAN